MTVIPYSLQASTTESSFVDPPGLAIYFTPDCLALSMLSRKGKKASELRATLSSCLIQSSRSAYNFNHFSLIVKENLHLHDKKLYSLLKKKQRGICKVS